MVCLICITRTLINFHFSGVELLQRLLTTSKVLVLKGSLSFNFPISSCFNHLKLLTFGFKSIHSRFTAQLVDYFWRVLHICSKTCCNFWKYWILWSLQLYFACFLPFTCLSYTRTCNSFLPHSCVDFICCSTYCKLTEPPFQPPFTQLNFFLHQKHSWWIYSVHF